VWRSRSASCATADWRDVREEHRGTRGDAQLVVVVADPNRTAREFAELRAEAAHKWMYPINPPEA
jgi:hypothetical protein